MTVAKTEPEKPAPRVHQVISRVLADLPAIDKNSKAPAAMGGYSFRGIDDVLNSLNPLLSEHGLFYMPTVLERRDSVRKTRSGGDLFVTNLLVKYTFYGPGGDYLECVVWGEGSDSGDKATQKALTGAMKYMLFQVFAISTQDMADMEIDRQGEVDQQEVVSDQEARKRAFFAAGRTVPEGWGTFEEFDTAHEVTKEGVKALPSHQQDHLREWRTSNSIGWPMTCAEMDTFLAEVEEVKAGKVDFEAATAEA
jgi:hypothetical protein